MLQDCRLIGQIILQFTWMHYFPHHSFVLIYLYLISLFEYLIITLIKEMMITEAYRKLYD